ncbi:MAG: SpoIID/LytB domain-containing protein, partial [Oscillospiraceae bacterium]
CGILQNETQGNLASEALKAHAVATYTYLKYNNALGTAPAVALGSPVCENVKKAVSAVLGQTVTCNGALINAVYHSTCGGSTTSAQSVWGGALSYLVSVESPWDKQAPKYAQSYSVSAASLASGVKRTYGISLEGNPSDWILVQRDAPGGYVGTVTLGGRTTALGGTYGSGKTITGRSIREQLFGYQIRSHCFDVAYDAGSESFRFTTYGYGHGVGMSQYGAHYMALDGYDYVQILTHYYTGTTVQ